MTIPAAAITRVERSFQLLLEGARQDQAIYGLTRSVDENKDKTIFKGGQLDSEVRRLSEEFNANLLRMQSTAVGPPAPDTIVRGAMAIQLK
ncbi:MAG: aromatic amino acid lyase [Solirubrobacteraceae bacterium]